ncbi:alpha/beta hydrolase family protein [Paraburkholderia diazotrophica]|uniref:Serine aminopeptidase, S33 n=1 Tax=Paraburkholderia diazotrophica TaxID=667676 RepID=A0A1H6RFI8_9BURK|nr:alpha/beta hydrolase [Paraburkholderia diazotrophica]SEI53206.1 Serine aminopeptidase, S33 [Paraburkholderia diazotrophica]
MSAMMRPHTMQPVVFDGCFGWLHEAADARARQTARVGVVLCSPFGYDALCAHRGWRELAEALALCGMPALRFDYPGTGDSIGVEQDPDRIGAWLASIEAAAVRLRAATGVQRLVLCGLRLGAALAALAAQRIGGVEQIVLLAPVISGRAYIRELELQHQTWLTTPDGMDSVRESDDGSIGAYGFRLYGETLERLRALDLTLSGERAPAPRILLQDVYDNPRVERLAVHYRRLGAHVDVQTFASYNRLLVDPRFSTTPRDAFDSVLTWLHTQPRATRLPPAPGDVLPARAPLQLPFADGYGVPVVFGDGLFGMSCRPRRALDDAPAVLLPNTGGVHHVGDGRLSVLLAQRLANVGVPTLRIDIGGLGDSRVRDPSLTFDEIYAHHAVDDTLAAVDWLAAQGHSRVVVFGVCTGAYVSLQAALAHPNVVGCMGVNLPYFVWPQTRSDARVRHTPMRVYSRSMRSLAKWRRLLTGKSDAGTIASHVASRIGQRLAVALAAPLERVFGLRTQAGDVRRLAAGLARKNARTALVYGAMDAGLDDLGLHFGPRGSELTKLARTSVTIIDRLDHALFSTAARDATVNLFEQFLREQIQAPMPLSLQGETRMMDTITARIGKAEQVG